MEIIGICGGSCSGKSTIVNGLASKIKDLTVIHFDDFFIGKDKLENQTIKNWEDPKLYRLNDYNDSLRRLKENQIVEIESNSRESKHEGIKTRIIKPSMYVVVEGFLTFYTLESRKYFDKKIFLDIPEEEIIKRRYERMKNGGGQYSDEYIRKTLIEEHRKNVLPQKQYADLIVDAMNSTEEILDKILSFLGWK